jgi:hypothetical protein
VINCRDPLGIVMPIGSIVMLCFGEDVASINLISRQMIGLSSHFGDTRSIRQFRCHPEQLRASPPSTLRA